MERHQREMAIESEWVKGYNHGVEQEARETGGTKIRQAVIIAAGNGSRLNGYQNGRPKPLVKVGGVQLLLRVIEAARRSGVEEFVIVIGYQAARIRRFISKHSPSVKIRWVRNREWHRQNGISVLKAEKYIDGNFFLFMSDHIFDPKILKRVSQFNLNGDHGVLCVDSRIPQIRDVDEATKVRTENGRLIDLSKRLQAFNAVDTGIFLCTPELFDALRQSQAAGDESLSGGIRVLSKRGKMATFDIGDAYWQDVDTVTDIRYAEKVLLQATRSKNDGPIARRLNRPISNLISSWLVKTSITPNHLSFLNFLFSLFTAWLLAAGKPVNTILGGIFFQLASVLDGCDGEVAVIKLKDSERGAFIDTVMDHLSYVAFVIGVTAGTYQITGNPFVFAITGGLLVFLAFALKLGLQFIRKQGSGSLKVLAGAVADISRQQQQPWYLKMFSALHHLGRRDMFAFLSFLIMLSGNLVLYYWLMSIAVFLMCMGISLMAASMLERPIEIRPGAWIKRRLCSLWQFLTSPKILLPADREIFTKPSESECYSSSHS